MNNIHSTAIVSSKAKLGDNITIAPFAIVHDDVEIKDGCYIGPKVVIYNGARIGSNVKIYQSASIAHIPQDKKFKGEYSLLLVGDNTTIHEYVTLHRGTSASGKTEIGTNVFLMAYTHVAHDCVIKNNVIVANCVQIGGHVEIHDFAFIGGFAQIHQFCKIGKYVMFSGGRKATMDVPPFTMAMGEPVRYAGLNLVGLKRRGFNSTQINTIKSIYHILYNSNLNFSKAKERIRTDFDDEPLAHDILDFLNKSTRGILR